MLISNRSLRKRITQILVLMVIFRTSLYNLGVNKYIFALIFITLLILNLGQLIYQREENRNE